MRMSMLNSGKQWPIATLVFALQILPIVCHPQCLDSSPARFINRRLPLCQEYEKIGCCLGDEDQDSIYNSLQASVPPTRWAKCKEYVRLFVCEQCSPYAAHTYEFNFPGEIDTLIPGLCPDFCQSFFTSCSDIIPSLIPDTVDNKEFRTTLLQKVELGAADFCKMVEPSDISYCYPDIKTNNTLISALQLKTETAPGCLCVEEVLSNLRSPLNAVHAADGSGRLFIAEQIGEVHILFPNGSMSNSAFLDITSSVFIDDTVYSDERGLLGIAFHPKYSTNGRFFIVYTRKTGETFTVQLSEFHVSAENPNKADETSEIRILDIPKTFSNHNGGQILFGADNYLYLFVGDGGYKNDFLQAGQDMSSLFGKVVRIDVDKKTGGKPYSVPSNNPFAGSQTARLEIFASGLRNPWRCGVDPGDSKTGYGRGRIICGDVGQSAYEELNMIKAGANYGWGGYEGPGCFSVKPETCKAVEKDPRLTAPIFMYNHTVGKCVIGGNFYRGQRSPRLNGQFFYGDISTGRLYRLEEDRPNGVWTSKEVTMCGKDVCKGHMKNAYQHSILSFGQDEEGEVYILSTDEQLHTAREASVYIIVDPGI